MNSERLVKWMFLGLSFLFILFIIYASWSPADDVAPEQGFFVALTSLRGHDLRDIATNVLMYMPLGTFMALAISGGKSRFLSPWIIVGPVVSLTMEVGQSFIGRTPDLIDLMTNSVGYMLGFWVVVAAVRFYGLNPHVFLGFNPNEDQDTKTQSIAAFRFIAVCIYVLIALLPLDVSVQMTQVYAQLFPDDTGQIRLILDPLYTVSDWRTNGLKLTFELWALIPIAALTAFLHGIRGRLSIFAPVFMCLVVTVLCESAQLFILSRKTDVVMVPIALLAGLLGWVLAKGWFRLQHVDASGHSRDADAWRPIALALLGYTLILIFFAWSPFDFETDLVAVAQKVLHESNLVPFKNHFDTRSLASAVDIVKEAGLFVPFGLLLSMLLHQLFPNLSRVKGILIVGVLCGGVSCATELSQAFCVGRYIDVTDVFLGGFGGLAGGALLRVFRLVGAHKVD